MAATKYFQTTPVVTKFITEITVTNLMIFAIRAAVLILAVALMEWQAVVATDVPAVIRKEFGLTAIRQNPIPAINR
jgi:hypothetical protein